MVFTGEGSVRLKGKCLGLESDLVQMPASGKSLPTLSFSLLSNGNYDPCPLPSQDAPSCSVQTHRSDSFSSLCALDWRLGLWRGMRQSHWTQVHHLVHSGLFWESAEGELTAGESRFGEEWGRV